MKRLIVLPLLAFLFLVVGCDSSGSSGATTSSAKPATTGSAKSSAKPATTASAKAEDGKGQGDGSGQGKGKGDKTGRELKKLTKKVMDALKEGKFDVAAEFVEEKGQEQAKEAFAKMVEKKKWRHDAIKAWSGKAGKGVRVQGDEARVEIGGKGDEIWVLQFKKKDKKWYVDDLKSPSKEDHQKWGDEI
jgi:predicted transcriptional regulator